MENVKDPEGFGLVEHTLDKNGPHARLPRLLIPSMQLPTKRIPLEEQ